MYDTNPAQDHVLRAAGFHIEKYSILLCVEHEVSSFLGRLYNFVMLVVLCLFSWLLIR